MEILGLILLGGIIWGIAVAVARANKRKMLMQKYNDVNVVNKIRVTLDNGVVAGWDKKG